MGCEGERVRSPHAFGTGASATLPCEELGPSIWCPGGQTHMNMHTTVVEMLSCCTPGPRR